MINEEILEEMRARKEMTLFIASLDGLEEIEIKEDGMSGVPTPTPRTKGRY